MTQDDLARMSREELIQYALKQFEENNKLRADNEALRLKMEKNKKPPTNSSNSSQPPSRDQKVNRPKDRKRHRHGPPVGHVKYERKFVAQPDHVVEVKPCVCEHCQSDLSAENGKLVDVNQITELPEAQAEVIEVRQYATKCPGCGREQIGEPPAGLEMGRSFGARMEGTVVYYRQEQHMSYVRTKSALCTLHGVEISEGGIDQIMQRAGQKALQEAETIKTDVRQSKVINSDETSCRLDSRNWWQWVFCSLNAVLHVIRDNRSEDVIREVMGDHRAEVWGSDCLTSQLKAPARERQICMAHQIRNLQAVIDRSPPAFWAQAMQKLFRYAIHIHNQRDQLSPEVFQDKLKFIERHCDWLVQQSLTDPDASRLQRRYQKYRQCLFVFLYRSDVAPTNNVSERALRPSVVHRKVIGCFRSTWGANAYAAFASVIATAALKNISSFVAIQSLFGPPSLPLPARL
jgi:transposase